MTCRLSDDDKPLRRTASEYGTAVGRVHGVRRQFVRGPVSRALPYAPDECRLTRVLEVFGDDADQPDAQGHRG
ncbi:hypothetical protein Smic_81840 [Streptomyces microflavus]|uniref:Uncharacterized protein n=1 Tax=Streptomyces microflavus TaxID=1919 RepID=A0A7J0D4K4_STRMI|nr:hypothetical protein Smic_81840 [Streptomyces microflavus]